MALDNIFKVKRIRVDEKVEKRKAEASTKEEQRQLELDYLKPEPLVPYGGEEPTIDPIIKLTVKLVFPSLLALEQFKRHFKVAKYVEPSVTNIGVLMALLDELDAQRIAYDKTTKKITYPVLVPVVELKPIVIPPPPPPPGMAEQTVIRPRRTK